MKLDTERRQRWMGAYDKGFVTVRLQFSFLDD